MCWSRPRSHLGQKTAPPHSETASSFQCGTRPLFTLPFGYTWGSSSDFYEVDSSDERFLMARAYRAEGNAELILVQNWFEELRERVGN